MGWGTFIAGRILRTKRYSSNSGEAMRRNQERMIAEQTDVELEVLEEIKRRKELGEEINVFEIRREIMHLHRVRRKLGAKLNLKIVQKAQELTLAGENVNYAEIEREILSTHKSPQLGRSLLKYLFPEHKIFLRLFNNYRSKYTK